MLASAALLAGCNLVVLNPAGDIAAQQGKLVIIATVLMLLIIVPVIFLTLLFAWRYRQNSKHAEEEYAPDWNHSTKLELVIWSVPLMIIIALGALTWITTHKLDPYRPLLTLLHTNVMGRAPSGAELQELLDFQADAGLDTVQTIALIARLPQAAERIDLDALASEGIAFQSFTGTLLGSAQDDRLNDLPGSQRIDGREGVDTLVYGGNSIGYSVERQADGSYAVEAAGGSIDQLWNVERLQFADTGVALDLNGDAGDALRLLQALAGDEALDNASWISQAIRYVDDLGLQGAARAVVDAGLAAQFAGGGSLEALIAKAYANVTGAAPSVLELQWHVDFAQQQELDAADVLTLVAQLPATAQRIDLVGLAQQGVAYEVWEG